MKLKLCFCLSALSFVGIACGWVNELGGHHAPILCTVGAKEACWCENAMSFAVCGPDGQLGECVCGGGISALGGAAATPPSAGTGGSFSSVSTAAAAAAGHSAPAANGGFQPAAAGAQAASVGKCPPAEMCQTASLGGLKFCAPTIQALPPPCTRVNQACGTDARGQCLDGSAVGSAGKLMCIYTACN
jgi:hypothetical protein